MIKFVIIHVHTGQVTAVCVAIVTITVHVIRSQDYIMETRSTFNIQIVNIFTHTHTHI